MKILVSACLLGENCKYNGGNNYSAKLQNYIKGNDVVALCPEVLGGLSIPRLPSEIVGDRVINCEGEDVSASFKQGGLMALKQALDVDVAILMSRSPSCGVNQIYDGTFSGKKIKGHGIFAQMLIDKGIKVIDVEDL